MAIQKSVNAYSFMCDAFVDLPATPPPGQLAYVIATGKTYYSQNGTWVELGGGSGSSLPSFDNPKASPHAYDDEFDGPTLDAKWTISSGYTGADPGVNTPVAGTVAPLASLTTPIYDFATWPGWMLVQSEETAGGTPSYSHVQIQQSVTLDTDATIFVCLSNENSRWDAAIEGSTAVEFRNSGDANESLGLRIDNTGSARNLIFWVENNGAFSSHTMPSISENMPSNKYYICIWKDDTVYRCAFSYDSCILSQAIGTLTKTGVTTFDRLGVRFYNANNTPSTISGISFFRYYAGHTYSFMN